METPFPLGYVILQISLLVAFVALNFILAEFAGQYLNNYWPWLAAFFVLPVISHAAFIAIITEERHRKRDLRAIRAGERITDPERRRPSHMVPETEDDASVTPFDAPSTSSPVAESVKPEILDELRDRKIDELMEWDQWSKAFELAAERLEIARDVGDRKSIELYETYLRLLGSKVHPIDEG